MAKTEYKIIGQRPIRPDAIDKVTGQATFGADFSLPRMLHGKVLRSDCAHARISNIDTTAATQIDGVHAVVTGKDFDHMSPGGAGDLTRDNLAIEKVLYHGHAVAAVAAISQAIADQALLAIKVEYEELPPVMTLDEAMKDEVILHEHNVVDGKPSNIRAHQERSVGDIERGFTQADEIVELEFITPTVHQGYIEPPVCLANYNDKGQSTLWSTTQGHFPLRDSVAQMMQMEQSELRVIPAEVGGAFGGKIATYQEAIALLLSKKSGRPVQMCMSREAVFRTAGPGAGSKIRVKVGAKKDGTLTAASAWMAYECGIAGGPMPGGVRAIFTPYDIPNVFVEGRGVYVNKPKVRAYRGPGAPQAVFAADGAIDELAKRIGMDPIEFRLKNAVSEGTVSHSGGTFRKIGLVECLEAAQQSEHYKTPLKANQGRAVSAGFWHNGAGVSSASLHMNSDGTAELATGSVDLSGTRIALAMMTAEELGIPVSQVSSIVADTSSVGFGGNSAGSRTINATGQAAVEATRDVVHQMKERAASGWNVVPEDVSWEDGAAVNQATGEKLTVAQICKDADGTGGPIGGRYSHSAIAGLGPSFAVHICDAEVDPDTGKVSILRYTAIQDAGTAIHRDAVEGQMQGGAVQGIGWATNEEFVYDERGVLENPGFLDYRVPLASDLPMIEAIVVEVPNELHPHGVRGVGEAPIIPPLAAVAGAVSNAIGVRITETPCSPPKVLAAMQRKG